MLLPLGGIVGDRWTDARRLVAAGECVAVFSTAVSGRLGATRDTTDTKTRKLREPAYCHGTAVYWVSLFDALRRVRHRDLTNGGSLGADQLRGNSKSYYPK